MDRIKYMEEGNEHPSTKIIELENKLSNNDIDFGDLKKRATA